MRELARSIAMVQYQGTIGEFSMLWTTFKSCFSSSLALACLGYHEQCSYDRTGCKRLCSKHGEGAQPGTRALQSSAFTDHQRISRVGKDPPGPSQPSCLDKSLSKPALPWGETGPAFRSEGANESYERFAAGSRREGGHTPRCSFHAGTELRAGRSLFHGGARRVPPRQGNLPPFPPDPRGSQGSPAPPVRLGPGPYSPRGAAASRRHPGAALRSEGEAAREAGDAPQAPRGRAAVPGALPALLLRLRERGRGERPLLRRVRQPRAAGAAPARGRCACARGRSEPACAGFAFRQKRFVFMGSCGEPRLVCSACTRGG